MKSCGLAFLRPPLRGGRKTAHAAIRTHSLNDLSAGLGQFPYPSFFIFSMKGAEDGGSALHFLNEEMEGGGLSPRPTLLH